MSLWWLGAKPRCSWQLHFIYKGPLWVLLIAQINSSPGQRELLFSWDSLERGAGNWLLCLLQSCFLMIFQTSPQRKGNHCPFLASKFSLLLKMAFSSTSFNHEHERIVSWCHLNSLQSPLYFSGNSQWLTLDQFLDFTFFGQTQFKGVSSSRNPNQKQQLGCTEVLGNCVSAYWGIAGSIEITKRQLRNLLAYFNFLI